MELRKMAFECGFMKRHARKIDAPHFLANLCLSSLQGAPSYNDLAARFNAKYHSSASKQAFWKRVDEACVRFFQAVLARIIQSKLQGVDIEHFKACSKYKRVIVQDSTIIRLPLRLFPIFTGVANAHKAVCNARIQGVYELLTGRFISFSIDPYSKNDLISAPELELQQGDLVLRDRGYSTHGEILRHIMTGADCIYRHKFSSVYLDPATGKVINLKYLLSSQGKLDIEVCLDDKQKTKVRLIAAPISQEAANQRRMKAKKEIKRHNPSEEMLFLMSWTIFITTIPPKEADFKKILAIYRLRWKIEIIFKIFKSHMSFTKIHNVSLNQLQVLLTARFIMIVLCIHFIYQPYYLKILKHFKQYLSMMKFIKYLLKNPEKLSKILTQTTKSYQSCDDSLIAIVRYCTYDKRKRLNYCQLLQETLLS